MDLNSVSKDQLCYIEDLVGEPHQRERLQELGLRKGLAVRVVRRLPFSGPLVVEIGPAFVALRKEEAQCVKVTSTSSSAS